MGEGRQAGRHLHLDIDIENVNALKGDGIATRDHGCRTPLNPTSSRAL